ncbi:MAG: hypothetical protein ABWZ91_08835 [Nocardioides sp.]|jgi:hypothetical protein
MSIDTAVDGDPGSCRRTARALHDLHGRLAEARSYLDGQAHLAAAHFDGLSGDAYRARCAAVGDAVDAAADSSRGLARALNDHADGLEEVLVVMADAREVARRELVLHGHTIPTPGGYATDRQGDVYRTVAASVQAARRDEARLRDAWLSALARYAVGPVEDLCLPDVTTASTRPAPPEPVASKVDAGAPRTSTAVPFAPLVSTNVVSSTTVAPPDSVWVPWGGGDAA